MFRSSTELCTFLDLELLCRKDCISVSGYCSARLGQLSEAAAPSCELCTECRAIHWRLPWDLGQQRAAGGHCQSTRSDHPPAGPSLKILPCPTRILYYFDIILNCISPEVCFETLGLCNCSCISRNLRPPCGSLTCLTLPATQPTKHIRYRPPPSRPGRRRHDRNGLMF